MPATSLQLIFALIPTTVSRYINFALQILLQVLRQMPEAAIVWPDALQIVENNTLIVARHPLLTGAFGSCDGLRLPVETSTTQTSRTRPSMVGHMIIRSTQYCVFRHVVQ
ncbi:hypothetical protein EWM64_g6551 [Hericium alpestre]|uniref:Uncharacterized protein n=1 Tax=Hericium alpestre TaxID=135208 RepID=A0A4Y9ZRP9_9AGAM|nr:hypothetical protein EWM64_g6551 [Hericium alpestre]